MTLTRLLLNGEAEVRILTVKPPWSWAIAWGGKDVENRAQLWRYRGPLLIHAGAGWSPEGAQDLALLAQYRGVARELWELGESDLPLELADGPAMPAPSRREGRLVHPTVELELPGPLQIVHSAIVAAAVLVEVHRSTPACCPPWGAEKAVHLALEDVTPLRRPVTYRKGALGLQAAPYDLLDEVRAELER